MRSWLKLYFAFALRPVYDGSFGVMNQSSKDDTFRKFSNCILTPYVTGDSRFVFDLWTYETRITNGAEACHVRIKHVVLSEYSHSHFFFYRSLYKQEFRKAAYWGRYALFYIHQAYFPTTNNTTKGTVADDTVILATHADPRTAAQHLQ